MKNKDMVTTNIQESLLNGERLGKEQLDEFVKQRECEPPDSDTHVSLKAPIHKNKAVTFASLYTMAQYNKGKLGTIKVDRNIFQRLITAYRAGRQVNLDKILQH